MSSSSKESRGHRNVKYLNIKNKNNNNNNNNNNESSNSSNLRSVNEEIIAEAHNEDESNEQKRKDRHSKKAEEAEREAALKKEQDELIERYHYVGFANKERTQCAFNSLVHFLAIPRLLEILEIESSAYNLDDYSTIVLGLLNKLISLQQSSYISDDNKSWIAENEPESDNRNQLIRSFIIRYLDNFNNVNSNQFSSGYELEKEHQIFIDIFIAVIQSNKQLYESFCYSERDKSTCKVCGNIIFHDEVIITNCVLQVDIFKIENCTIQKLLNERQKGAVILDFKCKNSNCATNKSIQNCTTNLELGIY
jgi:hypothetical protein